MVQGGAWSREGGCMAQEGGGGKVIKADSLYVCL